MAYEYIIAPAKVQRNYSMHKLEWLKRSDFSQGRVNYLFLNRSLDV